MQKKLSSKCVYDGMIFHVTRDEVSIKNKPYLRDVVHHNGGVGVLVVLDGKILLVKQYRYAISQDTLEVPAGKLELHEDPYTSAMRELEEETGFTCDTLHQINGIYSTPGFCNEKIVLYWAEGLKKVEHPRAMDEDEEIETLWLSIDEALNYIEDGRICDAKTVISVQYAKLHEQYFIQ